MARDKGSVSNKRPDCHMAISAPISNCGHYFIHRIVEIFEGNMECMNATLKMWTVINIVHLIVLYVNRG